MLDYAASRPNTSTRDIQHTMSDVCNVNWRGYEHDCLLRPFVCGLNAKAPVCAGHAQDLASDTAKSSQMIFWTMWGESREFTGGTVTSVRTTPFAEGVAQ